MYAVFNMVWSSASVYLRLHTRATPGPFPWALGDYSSPRSRIKQAGRQSDKETPARECRNDCVLRGHLGLLRNSPRLPVSVKTWPSKSHFLAGTRYFNTSTFCIATPALALCTTCKPRLCLSLSFLFCMDHGPRIATLTVHYSFTAAWKGKTPSRVAIPHRQHACHLQLPTHLDRWYVWGRHFVLLR